MADWKQGKFGCFDDMKLCLISFICPFATIGAIAEKLDEDTLVCGCLKMLIPIYNLLYFRSLRVKAAAKSGIEEESCCSFLCGMWCCASCVICQTGAEIGAWDMAEEMENQTIERV